MNATNQYPEHEKLEKIQPFSQRCGEFLEWLQDEKDIHFVKYDGDQKVYFHASTDELLAEFFGLDQSKLETEKRTMLELMKKMNENPNLCLICHSERDSNGRCRCRGNNMCYIEIKKPEVRA